MRPTRALLPALVPTLAAMALVGGCARPAATAGTAHPDDSTPKPTDNGVTAMAPNEIVRTAQAALAKADSVHVVGSGAAGGQQFGLDLKIKNQAGATGSLSIPVGGPGGSSQTLRLELVRIGQEAYVKGDDAFWDAFTGGSGQAAKLHGKWLKSTTQNGRLRGLFAFGDLPELAATLLAPAGALTKSGQRDIDGRPAIGLADAGRDGSMLYIATEGEPLPLRLVEGGKSTGSVDFQDYGKPVELTPPPAGLIVGEQELGL